MTAVIQVRENGSLDQVVAEEVMIRFWIYFEDRTNKIRFLEGMGIILEGMRAKTRKFLFLKCPFIFK